MRVVWLVLLLVPLAGAQEDWWFHGRHDALRPEAGNADPPELHPISGAACGQAGLQPKQLVGRMGVETPRQLAAGPVYESHWLGMTLVANGSLGVHAALQATQFVPETLEPLVLGATVALIHPERRDLSDWQGEGEAIVETTQTLRFAGGRAALDVQLPVDGVVFPAGAAPAVRILLTPVSGCTAGTDYALDLAQWPGATIAWARTAEITYSDVRPHDGGLRVEVGASSWNGPQGVDFEALAWRWTSPAGMPDPWVRDTEGYDANIGPVSFVWDIPATDGFHQLSVTGLATEALQAVQFEVQDGELRSRCVIQSGPDAMPREACYGTEPDVTTPAPPLAVVLLAAFAWRRMS